MAAEILTPRPNRPAKWIAKNLWRVNQGLSRIGLIWSLIGFLTFIKVWQPTFEYYGLTVGGVFLFLGILYLGSSWGVGYVNEKWNLSRAEWEHQMDVQNKEYFKMLDDIDDIKVMVEKMTETCEKEKEECPP